MATRTISNRELMAGVEEVVADGGRVKLRVKGFSMRPFLRDGVDVVELSPVSSASLRKGMVVLFRQRNTHLLHRVRAVKGDLLIIKGDGNYRTTETARRSDVAAVVSKIFPGGYGRGISYGSTRWCARSCRSLCRKLLRTAWLDLKRIVKKSIGYENKTGL